MLKKLFHEIDSHCSTNHAHLSDGLFWKQHLFGQIDMLACGEPGRDDSRCCNITTVRNVPALPAHLHLAYLIGFPMLFTKS